MAHFAAGEAMESARLDSKAVDMMCIGSAAGEIRAFEELPRGATMPAFRALTAFSGRLAESLRCTPESHMFADACIAGLQGLGTAFDAIRVGRMSCALVGGVDTISRAALSGFDALHALSPDLCRPFDRSRSGTQLGEAAGFLVLEEERHSLERGANPLCEVLGYGLSTDAHHPTRPDPSGAGAESAMRRAIQDAGISADDIDLVSAHGTGTLHNDDVELRAVSAVLGERARSVPIFSTKGQIGHTTGASGVVDVIAGLLAMQERFIPGIVTMKEPIEGFESFDLVSAPRFESDVCCLMKNAFGFGGMNCVVVVGKTGFSSVL